MKHALIALTLLVLVAHLDLARTRPPTPSEVPRPARPASCGAPVALTDVVPNPKPNEPEHLSIANLGPAPIELTDWTLAAGARRQRLGPTPLAPGERRVLAGDALGTLRLRNRSGEVGLSDPCGALRAHVSWDSARRGIAVEADARPP